MTRAAKCPVAECDRPLHGSNYCRPHYRKWKQYGDPLGAHQFAQGCSVDGCDNRHQARGFCKRHYRPPVTAECKLDGCTKPARGRGYCEGLYTRVLKGRDLEAPMRDHSSSLPERLWARVDKTDTCWNWTGSTTRQGYGHIAGKWDVETGSSPTLFTHRVAYELMVGPIPDGLVIDHLCKNTRCCNPAHLEPVTLAENTRRGLHKNTKKMLCPRGHAYDRIVTRIGPDGVERKERHCSLCDTDRKRRWREQQRIS